MPLAPLPIAAVLPDLIAALKRQPCAVLRAPTGAGKTTRVPPALLDSDLASLREAGKGTGRILLLEPRRLAARAAARRMSQERGQRLGDEIGYHVRFDRQAGPRTRVLAVTPGILLRYLHDDPFLESTAVVLFDEFHERSLESDLALGMVRLLQQTVRPELRIVVMSATLAVDAVASYLGGCPIIASEGRLHPVEVRYEPRPETTPWPLATARAVQRLLERTEGDLLVFLPGLQEIRTTARHLESVAGQLDLAVLPLHGDLAAELQDSALLPQSRRKVVLATNVAETSVTVEGITAVVDTGLARTLVFDPAVGLDRLKLTPISRASAEQRTGRAGRTRPGVCVRLWSSSAHLARPEQTEPEIRRVDLAGAVLHLLCLGEADIEHFPWLEPPPPATVAQALALLSRLGAVEDHKVTPLGRTLARLPVHPRIGRLLLEGQRWGVAERAALAAALLSERDPFGRSMEGPGRQTGKSAPPTQSDLLDRVVALEEFERAGLGQTHLGTLNRNGARFLLRARDQMVRSLPTQPPNLSASTSRRVYPGGFPTEDRRDKPGGSSAREVGEMCDPDEAFLRALLSAFPDRLAKRREPGGRRGVMVGGRGVRLAPSSGVVEPELFLCLDVDAGQGETLVRLASGVQRDWLSVEQLQSNIEVEFDAASERVTARKRLRFADLLLEETQAAIPEDQAPRVLLEAASSRLERVLPAEDSEAGLYLTRLRCLRQWLPELDLPAFAEADLLEVLTWLAPGCRSFADLRKADWLQAIQGKLSHTQRQAVEREAPERLEVPSGSRLTLKYELGRPPVLAVRIQEVFGLHETPRIAAGRVRVLLHLLGPNYRPQQVTDDLASFWTNTYPQVRKDLRARYPRHAWPDDPWTATAEHRPKRRNQT